MHANREARQRNYSSIMTLLAVSAALALFAPPVGSIVGGVLLLMVAGWLILSANTDTPLRNRTIVIASTILVGVLHAVFLGFWFAG